MTLIQSILIFIFLFPGGAIAQKIKNESLPHKNGNPMIPYVGMADPHIFIFNETAYLYSTRDVDSIQTKNKFVMPDWHIWSSQDLIHWKHERTIFPTETYMGKSNDCWATDMGWRNGKYYFYFSNKNISTGVMVADHPAGPFIDALGKPLLDTGLTTSKEYDPSILIDDDPGKTPYIIFGHHRDNDPILGYYIARLNEDMISLAEKPQKIYFEGNLNVLFNDDKPNLHKHNGIYYLSSGSHYATATSIYGPYTKRGNSGYGAFGLTAQAHGNYFMWNNQWFHTWCRFHLGKDVARYRESYITYVHYKRDGSMVDDTLLLSKHFDNGVGQYNAKWDKIEAEWYMSAANIEKVETNEGFEIKTCYDQGHLYYPNVNALKKNTTLSLRIKPEAGGRLEVRSENANGILLGSMQIPSGSAKDYLEFSCRLINKEGSENICLLFKGEKNKNLFSIDWISFN
jgi:arabinoxylan arabinofuranohydrolase